jgi:hypothetical protein
VTSPARRAPAPLVVAAGLVGVEAVALVVLGVAELGALSGDRVAMGATTSVFFLGYGAGLAFCAWMLVRLRSWARAPVVLTQLIQLGVAWSFRGGASNAASAALTVLAVLVLVGIFLPSSVAALGEDAEPGDRTPGPGR